MQDERHSWGPEDEAAWRRRMNEEKRIEEVPGCEVCGLTEVSPDAADQVCFECAAAPGRRELERRHLEELDAWT